MPATRTDDETGAVAVFMVMATTIVVIFVGIAVDLSGKLHAMQRAQDVARQAARSAAQAADGGAAVRGENPRVNAARAVQAGQVYLGAADVAGAVSVNGNTVSVTTTTTYTPVILALAGIGPQTVTGQSTARLDRVTEGRPG